MLLHSIQFLGNFNAMDTKFLPQLFHDDVIILGTGRIGGMVKHEPNNAVRQGLRYASPCTMPHPLRLGGQKVKHVQTKDNEIVQQP